MVQQRGYLVKVYRCKYSVQNHSCRYLVRHIDADTRSRFIADGDVCDNATGVSKWERLSLTVFASDKEGVKRQRTTRHLIPGGNISLRNLLKTHINMHNSTTQIILAEWYTRTVQLHFLSSGALLGSAK